MVSVATNAVAEETVVDLTVIPPPLIEKAVPFVTKFSPVKVSDKEVPTEPFVGDRDNNLGAGGRSVNGFSLLVPLLVVMAK
jgi:hypothetical protein